MRVVKVSHSLAKVSLIAKLWVSHVKACRLLTLCCKWPALLQNSYPPYSTPLLMASLCSIGWQIKWSSLRLTRITWAADALRLRTTHLGSLSQSWAKNLIPIEPDCDWKYAVWHPYDMPPIHKRKMSCPPHLQSENICDEFTFTDKILSLFFLFLRFPMRATRHCRHLWVTGHGYQAHGAVFSSNHFRYCYHFCRTLHQSCPSMQLKALLALCAYELGTAPETLAANYANTFSAKLSKISRK